MQMQRDRKIMDIEKDQTSLCFYKLSFIDFEKKSGKS